MRIARGGLPRFWALRRDNTPTPAYLYICGISGTCLLLELCLISVMLMPFVLPKMHERFFYPADVLSIVLVFYRPRLFLVPLAMITISFFSYQPFLFGAEPVPIGLLAVGVLVLLIGLTKDAGEQLYPMDPSESPEPASA